MTVDLDKLEALARAATHGERECVPSDDWSGMYRGIKAAGHGYIAEPTAHDEADLMMAVPDARFIAACDPTTVIALIAEIRKLRNVVALTNGVSDAILAQFVDQEILRAENDELKRLLDAGCQHPRGHGD